MTQKPKKNKDFYNTDFKPLKKLNKGNDRNKKRTEERKIIKGYI